MYDQSFGDVSKDAGLASGNGKRQAPASNTKLVRC